MPQNINLILQINPWMSAPIGVIFIYQLYAAKYNTLHQVAHTTIGTLLIFMCIQIFIFIPYKHDFSILNATNFIKQYQQRNIPILNTADMLNHQHLEFLLRAKHSLPPVTLTKKITEWSNKNPYGQLIITTYLKPKELFKYKFNWIISATNNSPTGDKEHHLFLLGICPTQAYLKHKCPPLYNRAHTK